MGRIPRHRHERSEFKRQSVAPWPPGKPSPADIANQVKYVPNGLHKSYPSAAGLWNYSRNCGESQCEKFSESRWPRLAEALKAAICAPCVSEEFRGDFPARAWAFVNGKLHEARLSNRGSGEYHAFPLEYEGQWPLDPEGLLSRCAPHVEIPRD